MIQFAYLDVFGVLLYMTCYLLCNYLILLLMANFICHRNRA